jgi:hypothetical protein
MEILRMQTLRFGLIGLLILCSGLTHAQQPAETPKTPTPEERIRMLEERVRLLEKLLIDKDLKIQQLEQAQAVPLNRQTPLAPQASPAPQAPHELGGQPQQPQNVNPWQRVPGQTFELPPGMVTPEQMRELQSRLESFMQREFDNDDDFFNRPFPDPFDDGPNQRWVQPQHPGRRVPPLLDRRPRLGASLKDSDPELRERFGNSDALEGAFVLELVPGLAAEAAGFQIGDCVIEFNGRPIKSSQEVVEAVQNAPDGEQRVIVLRRGNRIALKPNLGSATPPSATPKTQRQRKLSLYAEQFELPEALAKQLELTEAQREKMVEVLNRGKAALQTAYLQEPAPAGIVDLKRLRALLTVELQKAESELRSTLSENQMSTWRNWREEHQGLSASLSEQRIEGRQELKPRPGLPPESKGEEYEF